MSLCVKKAPGDPHWVAPSAKITLTHHASLFDVAYMWSRAIRITLHTSRVGPYVESWLNTVLTVTVFLLWQNNTIPPILKIKQHVTCYYLTTRIIYFNDSLMILVFFIQC